MTRNHTRPYEKDTSGNFFQDSSYTKTLLSNPPDIEPESVIQQIQTLDLKPHPEGGYYVETDRDPLLVPNPFQDSNSAEEKGKRDSNRNASTTIFYLLSPRSPVGHFHRNKARTVHTLHRGRGRYVVVHADEYSLGKPASVESFVVGHDLRRGERMQWIVEGGKFKASFLLPDSGSHKGSETGEEGLLISETVVPGFEFEDHDFMTADLMKELIGEENGKQLAWLLKEDERQKWQTSLSAL